MRPRSSAHRSGCTCTAARSARARAEGAPRRRVAADVRRRVTARCAAADLLTAAASVVLALAVAPLWGYGSAEDALAVVVLGAARASRAASDAGLGVRAPARRWRSAEGSYARRRQLRRLPAARGACRFCAGRWDARWKGLGAPLALAAAGRDLHRAAGHEGKGTFAASASRRGRPGRALREHEQLAASLAVRIDELAREEEAYAQLSVRNERARIAAELHDVVAHAISVMVIQAGAGQRLAATRAASSRARPSPRSRARRARPRAISSGSSTCSPTTGTPRRSRRGSRPSRSSSHGPQPAASTSASGARARPRTPAGAGRRARASGRAGGRHERVALRIGSADPRARAGESRRRSSSRSRTGRRARPARSHGDGTGNGLRGLRERAATCGGTIHAGPDAGWRLAVAGSPAAGRRRPVSINSNLQLELRPSEVTHAPTAASDIRLPGAGRDRVPDRRGQRGDRRPDAVSAGRRPRLRVLVDPGRAHARAEPRGGGALGPCARACVRQPRVVPRPHPVRLAAGREESQPRLPGRPRRHASPTPSPTTSSTS